MRYRIFGRRSGLRVSELALGTGNFGTGWGHGAERDEASAVALGGPQDQIDREAPRLSGGDRSLVDTLAVRVA